MKLKSSSLALLVLVSSACPVLAQPSFLEVTPLSIPLFTTPEEEDFWVSAVAPADADGDGDIDLAVLGYHVVYNVSATDQLVLLLNQGAAEDGNWSFTAVQVPLGGLFAGASDLAWGDFDADGDHDLVVGSEGATVIYANSGGTLTALSSVLPGYFEQSTYVGAYDLRSLSWSDFDNDGDLDLLIPSGWDGDTRLFSTHLMRNDGPDGAGGWAFADTAADLAPTSHAQSGWADDDADGDLDLLLVNVDPFLDQAFIRRYTNTAGVFTGSDLLGNFQLVQGLADWGDADGDGDLDLLVAGNLQNPEVSGETVLRLYRREGSAFIEDTLIQAPNADWLDVHAATWADYDSDGDVDILLTGNYIGVGEIVGHSRIFANQGGTFVPLALELPAPYGSIGRGGSFSWFDLDQDGDLDYLVAGAYFVPGGNGLVEAQMHLYRNGAAAANAAPTAASGLVATTAGPDGVRLRWNPAADDHTASAVLTYDLELRRNGVPFGTTRRLPEPGNISRATTWELVGLPPGEYTWSVMAVDTAFRGGTRTSGAFTIGADVFRDGFESGGTGAWSVVVGILSSPAPLPLAAPATISSGWPRPARTLPPRLHRLRRSLPGPAASTRKE